MHRHASTGDTCAAARAALIRTAGAQVDTRTHSDGTWPRAGSPARPDPDAPSAWPDVDGYQLHGLQRATPSADVYLAYHPATRGFRELIVVQRLPDVVRAELRRAVEAAVSAAGAVGHAGIAPVAAVGLTRDGRLYVATARPAGPSLVEVRTHEGPLPVRRALALGLAIVDVVAAAHNRGVIHGRLTPDSVVVVPQQPGQPERVVVLGFGTAAAQDSTLVLGGTSGERSPFVSPERTASGQPSLRDDVFGLGSVLMSMFLGGPPSLVRAPVGDAGQAEPHGMPQSEPGQIIQVLRRARSADPGHRYATAAALGAALRAINDALAARPIVVPPSVARPIAAPPSVVRPIAAPPIAAPPIIAERLITAPITERPPAERLLALQGPPVFPVAVPPREEGTSPRLRRRARRGALAAAGVVGAVATGWAARAWQRHTVPAFPLPPAEVTRKPEHVAPPRPAPSPTMAAAPTAAAPTAAAPTAAVLPARPEPAGRGQETAPSTARPAAARTTAPRSQPGEPSGARLAAHAPGASARDAARLARRPASPVGPVVAAAGATAGTNGRSTERPAAIAPGAATASATGDVVAASPAAEDAGAANRAAASTAAGIRAAVAEYANAIEARDLASLGRVYPDMTAQQRRAWATFFGSVADLRARLEVEDITTAGATAQVRVRGTYEYQNLRPHRAERSPVRFTATLARDASGWRVRTVE